MATRLHLTSGKAIEVKEDLNPDQLIRRAARQASWRSFERADGHGEVWVNADAIAMLEPVKEGEPAVAFM
jgi:hypothetical protein